MEFVQNNLIWIGIAFVSGAMLLFPLVTGRAGGPGVSPMQATLLINREDAIVLDVREAAEFAQGHIPNSRHIPLAQLDKRLVELEKFKDKSIIVNCASGSRSSSACGRLRKRGFTKVFNLAGGISAWDQAGLPVTKK
ncbi:MAG: rhodanese-like domain-containing protein [Rhodocyclales bacterium]|nr:rhodanese-like domain-containing protein [Rhodocyclales bacterium]